MTLYRLVGLPSYNAAVREKYRQSSDGENGKEEVRVAGTKAFLYWSTVKRNQVKWTDTIRELTKKELMVGNATVNQYQKPSPSTVMMWALLEIRHLLFRHGR